MIQSVIDEWNQIWVITETQVRYESIVFIKIFLKIKFLQFQIQSSCIDLKTTRVVLLHS